MLVLGCPAPAIDPLAGETSATPTTSGDGTTALSTAPGESTAVSDASPGETSRGDTTPDPSDGPSTDLTDGDASGPGVIFDVAGGPDAPGIDPECEQNVDIVFVIDVSTTMAELIQILSDEILAVDAAVAELDLLGETHYGLAVFVDDALLVNEGAPYEDALALQADFDMWAAFTATNQQVGGGNGNFTFTENSLDALYFAAADFEWRPELTTTRIIIHVTDDTFWDGPTVGNGVNILHGYAETVDALQDQSIRVYSFADDIGGACECEDVTPGWSMPYMNMPAIPEATDGGVYAVNQILLGQISLSDAIDAAVEESFCSPYEPIG